MTLDLCIAVPFDYHSCTLRVPTPSPDLASPPWNHAPSKGLIICVFRLAGTMPLRRTSSRCT